MGRPKQNKVRVEEVEVLEEPVPEENEIEEEALCETSEENALTAEEAPTKAEVITPVSKRKRSTSEKTRSEFELSLEVPPQAQIELATKAMQNTMTEMVKQWEQVQKITEIVSKQLEKVAHIVKPSIQDFVETNTDLLSPHSKQNSQKFAMRFTIAASVVAVLVSLISMSLSQSARTVTLNAEATRLANNPFTQEHYIKAKSPEVLNQTPKGTELSGPKRKVPTKAKAF